MAAQGQSSTGNYFNSSWKYLAPDFARSLYLKQSALWLESDPSISLHIVCSGYDRRLLLVVI